VHLVGSYYTDVSFIAGNLATTLFFTHFWCTCCVCDWSNCNPEVREPLTL